MPIVWGGYFPTLYPEAAVNAPYVDVVVRGPGEETLLELLARVDGGGGVPKARPLDLSGRSRRHLEAGRGGRPRRRSPVRAPDGFPPLPLERLRRRLAATSARTFLGRRTGVHQAAIGCRYRCSFCGVVSMFGGKTLLSGAARMLAAVEALRDRHGADAVQFYDNNFFDSEESSVPVLEALSRAGLPYWCYARPDTLAGFSARTWELARRSGLRMAYIGAEAGSDRALRAMHKGTKVEQTFEVARRCREYGVVPEFSFVLGGPEDPEGEVENTLLFVRRLKAIHPECEVILYFYTPTPQRTRNAPGRDGPASAPSGRRTARRRSTSRRPPRSGPRSAGSTSSATRTRPGSRRSSEEDPRLRDGSRLPVPDRPGRPAARLGEDRPPGSRLVALGGPRPTATPSSSSSPGGRSA